MKLSLKRDIIIKNRFSVSRFGQGTRGNTPGAFVLRYMARDDATETVTPVIKYNIDTFITRYIARDHATEQAQDLNDLHNRFYDAQGLAGRGFGKAGRSDLGNVSLSNEEIHKLSHEIQQSFDRGKTVLESVISFDGHYLQRNGLADKSVKLDKQGHATYKGAFRGKVDQMKLRMAIMNGLNRMANRRYKGKNRYDSLAYVGVIQVDTKQVHCHLALVDTGVGHMIYTKGFHEQKGEINDMDMMVLRRGIDEAVSKYQPVRQLSSSIMREKQDTRSYVRRYTQTAIQKSNFAQILLATLPKDKKLWQANSNSREMKQPNQILHFYVEQVLKSKNSGFQKATAHIQKYASIRQQRENLSNSDYQRLIDNGQERIYSSCMDSVYSLLKTVPQKDKTVHSRVLDGLSASIDALEILQRQKPRDPAMDFSYHLRSYTHRLSKHRQKAVEFSHAQTDYLKKQQQGLTDPASLAVLRFYQVETEYHNKLMVKYQLMLPLISRRRRWQKMQSALKLQHDKLMQLQKMQDDAQFSQMSQEDAQKYGEDKYKSDRGGILSQNPDLFDNLLKQDKQDYADHINDFREELAMDNRILVFNKKGEAVNKKQAPYKFEDVKGLDLQDMGDDFQNLRVDKKYVDEFVKLTKRRVDAYNDMQNYAIKTRQPQLLLMADYDDIQNMKQTADNLQQNLVLPQKQINNKQTAEFKYTVDADNKLTDEMQAQIEKTMQQVDLNLDQDLNNTNTQSALIESITTD